MKYIGVLIVAFLFFSCSSPVNQETVNYEGETILVGEVNWEGLTKAPYSDWFTSEYLAYHVDTLTLSPINERFEEVEVIVFLGTWCTDSQVEVPHFYKILDFLHYDLNKMEVFALEKLEDKRMVSPQQQEDGYGITHVPTFIFKRNGREIGRIIEYPEKTLEKDMVTIIMN